MTEQETQFADLDKLAWETIRDFQLQITRKETERLEAQKEEEASNSDRYEVVEETYESAPPRHFVLMHLASGHFLAGFIQNRPVWRVDIIHAQVFEAGYQGWEKAAQIREATTLPAPLFMLEGKI